MKDPLIVMLEVGFIAVRLFKYDTNATDLYRNVHETCI